MFYPEKVTIVEGKEVDDSKVSAYSRTPVCNAQCAVHNAQYRVQSAIPCAKRNTVRIRGIITIVIKRVDGRIG